ncbi:MAG: FAD-binding oxidoreductase, partial [Acinetobacter sp.]
MSHVMQYQPQWIREDFVDFIAEKVNPVWAWKKVKASIVDVHMLNEDFYQIQLQPNHNFQAKAFRAGQSILVTVVIAGVRQQRNYSIVKITAHGNIVIAVKRQGKVSNALTHLTVGSVVEISQVQGDFTLSSSQAPILLLASGSGITAIYSLLEQALAQKVQQIDLLYFTRDNAFHTELM